MRLPKPRKCNLFSELLHKPQSKHGSYLKPQREKINLLPPTPNPLLLLIILHPSKTMYRKLGQTRPSSHSGACRRFLTAFRVGGTKLLPIPPASHRNWPFLPLPALMVLTTHYHGSSQSGIQGTQLFHPRAFAHAVYSAKNS